LEDFEVVHYRTEIRIKVDVRELIRLSTMAVIEYLSNCQLKLAVVLATTFLTL